MKKQFVLISGLASVATLAVAGLAVARGNTVLADPVVPGNYVAVINSENRIKHDENDSSSHAAMNGFRLHGGEEYGQFSVSNMGKIDLNEESCGFSITMTDSFYFGIKTSALPNDSKPAYYWDVKLDGKTRRLRGFPGAYKIEIIYDIDEEGITLRRTADANEEWNYSTSQEGNTITDTYTVKEAGNLDKEFSFVRDLGGSVNEYTYKVHSLTIWYTC